MPLLIYVPLVTYSFYIYSHLFLRSGLCFTGLPSLAPLPCCFNYCIIVILKSDKVNTSPSSPFSSFLQNYLSYSWPFQEKFSSCLRFQIYWHKIFHSMPLFSFQLFLFVPFLFFFDQSYTSLSTLLVFSRNQHSALLVLFSISYLTKFCSFYPFFLLILCNYSIFFS